MTFYDGISEMGVRKHHGQRLKCHESHSRTYSSSAAFSGVIFALGAIFPGHSMIRMLFGAG